MPLGGGQTQSHLFARDGSRLMPERSLDQSEARLGQTHSSVTQRQAGADVSTVSLLLIKTVWGGEQLDKSQTNQRESRWAVSSPLILGKSQNIDLLYKVLF